MWPFHKHYWKLVSANVSSRLSGFAAVATLECEHCGKRKFFQRGVSFVDTQFPSKNAARVWVESLLPKGHRQLEITDTKKVEEE
jgi:hypothetical protein